MRYAVIAACCVLAACSKQEPATGDGPNGRTTYHVIAATQELMWQTASKWCEGPYTILMSPQRGQQQAWEVSIECKNK